MNVTEVKIKRRRKMGERRTTVVDYVKEGGLYGGMKRKACSDHRYSIRHWTED